MAMLTLDFAYSYYITQTGITVNSYLANRYQQYENENVPYEDIDFDIYDYELESFLVNLIEKAECRTYIEIANSNDMLVQNYAKLSDLIEYIYKIKFLNKKYKRYLAETFFSSSKLADIQFEESRLRDFSINNQNHRCELRLDNVLLYNKKRKNKRIPVDCGNALLQFVATESVEMNGILSPVCIEANYVYDWHLRKESDSSMKFCIFLLTGHRKCILQIKCSDIDIKVS
jgi:hypothetical protein